MPTPAAPARQATCADDGGGAGNGSTSDVETLQEKCAVEQVGAKLTSVIQRINQNKAPSSIHALKRGWARKPTTAKRCNKHVKRRAWIVNFYNEAVKKEGRGRANEWKAQRQLTIDFPDDDSMWMEAASLKSAFGKLAVLRKAREAAEKAAAAERALATAVVGASQAEGAPQDNETESAEPTIRLVIEEEEARLDDIVACDEDCQPGDGADTEEDLVQKLEEAGEKEFIAQVVNPELEHV